MAAEGKWQARAERYRREHADQVPPRKGSYIWRVAPGDLAQTRPEHRRLNGRKFRWDDPPVVNPRTGERGHPGADKHCRCYAEPVAD